jgi:CCR4-NOT transcription complex subunit 1
MANQLSAQAQAQAQGHLSYTAIDALSKLIVWLVKVLDPALPGGPPPGSVARKIKLLSLFLTSLAHVLVTEFETKQERFNQRPYLRLLTNLIQELNIPDPVKFDSNQDGVLLAFADCLGLLRPTKVPVFAFAWLELVSHRMFMPKMLLSKSPRCQVVFQRLLLDLFVLMQPYLRNAELSNSIRLLYRGTLRVLLVLLHDFPEFLCDFHFSFCDVIPTTCIQMRNLILSAFPRNMCLPDPFTPNLKVDLLPEIALPPRIVSDVMGTLDKCRHVLVHVDGYLAKRGPVSAFAAILSALSLRNTSAGPGAATKAVKKAGTQYNVPLINSLVLYVGGQGIAKLKSSSAMPSEFHSHACMDIFDSLVTNLDSEGRYYVLNAIVNQLRYPNNHTHYFSRALLSLFLNAKQAAVMEQITRVLLERLIVHRPHPWGLLITFIELIKNPRYDFWERPFIHCAPDIERLFECVARSCIPAPKPGAPGGVAGTVPGQ